MVYVSWAKSLPPYLKISKNKNKKTLMFTLNFL